MKNVVDSKRYMMLSSNIHKTQNKYKNFSWKRNINTLEESSLVSHSCYN